MSLRMKMLDSPTSIYNVCQVHKRYPSIMFRNIMRQTSEVKQSCHCTFSHAFTTLQYIFEVVFLLLANQNIWDVATWLYLAVQIFLL